MCHSSTHLLEDLVLYYPKPKDVVWMVLLTRHFHSTAWLALQTYTCAKLIPFAYSPSFIRLGSGMNHSTNRRGEALLERCRWKPYG